ncbi:MAG TPA: MGMT family protein [Patescibacteria group bacterium]|jgi:methylated-DNA-[protein]-cysteine S-methyltransferase|nr:MGMT family protein [Patescibacteria group bacterium]
MTPLQEKTYELLKKVPKGNVTTYKALADALGTKAYRAIGQFMRSNPYAPQVPCHRVVASDGTIGGFRGKTKGAEIQQKIALLTHEGVQIENNRVVDFQKRYYHFP